MLDMLVIGAGPAGLYAAYYAGFRGLTVGIMDSLPEVGGQVSALYPEKAILDVAGFPATSTLWPRRRRPPIRRTSSVSVPRISATTRPRSR